MNKKNLFLILLTLTFGLNKAQASNTPKQLFFVVKPIEFKPARTVRKPRQHYTKPNKLIKNTNTHPSLLRNFIPTMIELRKTTFKNLTLKQIKKGLKGFLALEEFKAERIQRLKENRQQKRNKTRRYYTKANKVIKNTNTHPSLLRNFIPTMIELRKTKFKKLTLKQIKEGLKGFLALEEFKAERI